MKTEGLARQQVLREMMDLAMGRANDAVKLAYLDQDGLGQIDGLDLRCLTEFKRSSNGAVEVKLTDRVAVLEKLLEQQKAEEDGLGAFLEAMDRPAAPEGMCSQRCDCNFRTGRSRSWGGGAGAPPTGTGMPLCATGQCAAGRPCAWGCPSSCGA